VLVYKPPEKVVLAWHLNAEFKYDPDPTQATMVTITFTEEGPTTTRVELEHSGLQVHGDSAEGLRGGDRLAGWLDPHAHAPQGGGRGLSAVQARVRRPGRAPALP
jgi:hypothetical protein